MRLVPGFKTALLSLFVAVSFSLSVAISFGATAAIVSVPQITGLSRPAGAIGTYVVIQGTGLSNTTAVHFTMKNYDGTPQTANADFQILDDTQVRARIWGHSVTGPITVDVAGSGTLTSPVFRIRTDADYDGDNRADILWEDATGGIGVWMIANLQIKAGGFIGNVPLSFQFVGEGDFNGDGRSDILWRDGSGQYGIWFLNGASILSGGALPSVPADFTFAGIGDFDDDGKDDILWRDGAGGVGAWLMDGLLIKAAGYIGSAPVGLTLVGIGDLDGDGKADIVFEENSSRVVGAWFMNGLTIVSGSALGTALASIPSVFAVTDLNGDGWADIFFFNLATGGRTYWEIKNGAVFVTALNGFESSESPKTFADYDGYGGTKELNIQGVVLTLWLLSYGGGEGGQLARVPQNLSLLH